MAQISDLTSLGIQPALAETLVDLLNKKLWHQLTLKIHELGLEQQRSASPSIDLLALYNCIIKDNFSRLNTLPLTYIAILTANQIPNYSEKIGFMEKFAQSVSAYPSAHCLSKSMLASYLLQEPSPGKGAERCAEILQTLVPMIETHGQVNISVMGEFYKVSADLNRRQGKYTSYYHNMLKYLGCLQSNPAYAGQHHGLKQDLLDDRMDDADDEDNKASFKPHSGQGTAYLPFPTEDELLEIARCLCVAALLSSKIYNFGELITHPIFNHLRGAKDAWLAELTAGFNDGNHEAYNRIMGRDAHHYPAFEGRDERLRSKFSVMCFLNLCFERSATNRCLRFTEITERACVSENMVERILITALAQNTIKAAINQVERTVEVTWVTPRILSVPQRAMLADQVGAWVAKIDQTLAEAKHQQYIPALDGIAG